VIGVLHKQTICFITHVFIYLTFSSLKYINLILKIRHVTLNYGDNSHNICLKKFCTSLRYNSKGLLTSKNTLYNSNGNKIFIVFYIIKCGLS